VFADAVWGRTYADYDLEAFEARLAHAYHSRRRDAEPIGIVLAHWLPLSLHKRVKKAGLILYTFEQLFGQRALELVDGLSAVIAAPELDFKEMQRLLKGIGDLDRLELLGNVLGKFFEYIMVDCLRRRGYPDPKQGVLLSRSGDGVPDDMELDIVADHGREVLIVECKGYSARAPVPRTDVKKFFGDKFFPAVKALRSRYPRAQRFLPLLATSSGLHPDAREYVDDWAQRNRKMLGNEEVLLERGALVEELDDRHKVGADILRDFYA